MKKGILIAAAIAAAALLLAACSGGNQTEERAAQLRERYAALTDYTATAQVELPRAEETLCYTLAVEGNEEKTMVEVLEPELLQGICVSITGEERQLHYEGLVLDAGTAAPGLDAPQAVPLLLAALAEGYVTECGEEEENGEKVLRLGLETEVAGKTLLTTVWLAEDDRPLRAEFSQNGEILLTLEFTDFGFGAIMPLNTDAT